MKRVWDRIASTEIGRRMAYGAFWSLTGSLVSQGLMLLASIVVARLLGKAEYGQLGMIRSTVNMFAVFAGFGLGMTATKYISQFRNSEREKTGKIIGLTTLFAGFTGGLIALIILLMAPYLAASQLHAPELVNEIRLGAVMLFFSALNGAQTGALSGFEAFKTIAKVNLISGLLAFPVQVFFTWFFGLPGSVMGFGANFLILWILNFFSLRRTASKAGIKIHFRGALHEWKVLFHFSLPALLSGLLVAPVMWICNLMLVDRPGGYGEMALFDAANQWRNAVLFIPAILAQIALPMLSSHSADPVKFNRILNVNIRMNLLVALLFAVIIALLSGYIMSSYGTGFAEGRLVLVFLAFSTVLVAVNNIIGQAIAGKGKMWPGFFLNLIWSAVILASSTILLRLGYGATGLAAAFLISYSVHTITQTIYIKAQIRRQKRQMQSSDV
jgi:O-antigen/teichoic acid export membrane protein